LDWSYIRSAQVLAQTGHIVYNGWAAPMLGWQLLLGAVFIKLFGFSFLVLRTVTVLIATLTAFLFHRILVRCGVNEYNSSIGTLTLALSAVPTAHLQLYDGYRRPLRYHPLSLRMSPRPGGIFGSHDPHLALSRLALKHCRWNGPTDRLAWCSGHGAIDVLATASSPPSPCSSGRMPSFRLGGADLYELALVRSSSV
jgi:hypothetical protein